MNISITSSSNSKSIANEMPRYKDRAPPRDDTTDLNVWNILKPEILQLALLIFKYYQNMCWFICTQFLTWLTGYFGISVIVCTFKDWKNMLTCNKFSAICDLSLSFPHFLSGVVAVNPNSFIASHLNKSLKWLYYGNMCCIIFRIHLSAFISKMLTKYWFEGHLDDDIWSVKSFSWHDTLQLHRCLP